MSYQWIYASHKSGLWEFDTFVSPSDTLQWWSLTSCKQQTTGQFFTTWLFAENEPGWSAVDKMSMKRHFSCRAFSLPLGDAVKTRFTLVSFPRCLFLHPAKSYAGEQHSYSKSYPQSLRCYLLDQDHPSNQQQLGAKPRAFEIPTQFP